MSPAATPQQLYEVYDSAARAGFANFKAGLPPHIVNNLHDELREYQVDAVGRWFHYYDNDTNKRLPVQLMFNMATGSGKTLVMAALILDLYKRGRRNFIFFVNSTNIIDKTRNNFINISHPKYLFADKIEIDGRAVPIKEVQTFAGADPNAINILLTTTQSLHATLNKARENSLTYQSLAQYHPVLIGDEAHHNNASNSLTNSEKEENKSWEDTVNAIIKECGAEAILLEFTATIDMADASIFQKYYDRLICRYDLRAFREDGFSKDVLIYSVDAELAARELQAIIISQYRKKVALENGVFLKPVVMFKSKTKKESEENFANFNMVIGGLSSQDIAGQRKKASEILQKAFAYFDAHGISNADLAEELREDFRQERLVIIDGNNVTPEKQRIVNSLEEPSNEYRAIFTVDMLKEGWDVLNLFDIVRLYDTRDGGGHGDTYKPGKTTTSEAQLIGRGARYFPFVLPSGSEAGRYMRKFDNDEDNELRVLEQLHYHSQHNVRYIAEIRQTLDKTGITNYGNQIEATLELKSAFIESQTYNKGVIWLNERIPKIEAKKLQQQTLGFEELLELPAAVSVELPSGIGHQTNVFGENTSAEAEKSLNEFERKSVTIHVGAKKEITPNVIRAAMARNKAFDFNKLHEFLFASRDAFINSLGKIDIEITGVINEVNNLSSEQKLFIAEEILRHIELRINTEAGGFAGTDKFIAKPLSELFQKRVTRKYTVGTNSDSEGYSQMVSSNYGLNLKEQAWYAYTDNFGTSEEKSLVKTLEGLMEELSKKWTDIYLLRNEHAVRIYSFDDGQAFEPDYILLANDKNSGNISWQIFIEPKGDQFLGADRKTFVGSKEEWKQKFLAQITERDEAKVLIDSDRFKVVGLPFYNEQNTKDEFVASLKSL